MGSLCLRVFGGTVWGGWRGGLGRVQKRPTVGRRCDLLWVASETYSRFFRRPTVDRFWRISIALLQHCYAEAFSPVQRAPWGWWFLGGLFYLSLAEQRLAEWGGERSMIFLRDLRGVL